MPNIFKQGDWAESFMKGMEMARMKEQGEIQREQLQQQQAERKMRMEEFRLKINDMLDKKKEAERIKAQYAQDSKGETITEQVPDPNSQGDEYYPNMMNQTRTMPSAIQQKFGDLASYVNEQNYGKVQETLLTERLKQKEPTLNEYSVLQAAAQGNPIAIKMLEMKKGMSTKDSMIGKPSPDKFTLDSLAEYAKTGDLRSLVKNPASEIDPVAHRQLVNQVTQDVIKRREDALNQENNMRTITNARNVVSKGGVSGKWGQFKGWIAPYAESMGIDISGMKEAEAFGVLTRLMVGPMRLAIIGSGPVSDWEQKLMTEVSGKGATKYTAMMVLNEWEQKSKGKIADYNNTLKGAIDLNPAIGKVYQPISLGEQEQPPSGYKNSGKTSGGKPVWVSPDGKYAWVEP